MKKYYLMAIELNNSDAMYYYEGIKDYDNINKYYLMAIELNKMQYIKKFIIDKSHV